MAWGCINTPGNPSFPLPTTNWNASRSVSSAARPAKVRFESERNQPESDLR
jgi:hypothetical protein